MGFGQQLSRAFGRFGKQLSNSANVIGRQIVNTSNEISSGINQARKVVSAIESGTKNIPIVGNAVSALNSGLGATGNIVGLAGVGGQALRDVSSGNYKNLANAYQAGNALVGSLASNVTSGVASGLGAVASAGL